MESGAPAYLIAEIGANHNGDWGLAEEMTRACALAGADAVKFQAYSREELFISCLPEDGTEASRRNRDLLKRRWNILPRFTVPDGWWPRLAVLCNDLGIDFLCTPFDLKRLDLLVPLMPAIKVASGDVTWHELLEAAGAAGKPVIFSTGASTLEEARHAAEAVRRGGCNQVAVLHCVSNYPPKWEDANLLAMESLGAELDLPFGLSDHTPGSTLPLAAVARGACMVEKHVTTDRTQEGLDHHFAMTIEEFGKMVEDIRHLEAALGSGDKDWADSEEIERYWLRRGIWAAHTIEAGHKITREDLRLVRPCHGIPANRLSCVLGRITSRPLKRDQPLFHGDLQ